MKSPLGLIESAVLVMVAGAILGSGPASARDIYVATDGRDAWSGRFAAPDAGGKDGPFATLDRARDEIRKLKRENGLLEPVTVHVRAGTYFMDRTFTLTAEDSGTADAPIVYRGHGAERPLLVGGKPVAGFAPHKDHVLVADVAAQGLKGIAFRQLFFNGRRQILARYPNFDPKNPYAGGWIYADGKPMEMYKDQPGDSKRLLPYKEEDARHCSKPEEGDICIFPRYNWWNNIVRIVSNDRGKRVLALAQDCSYAIRPGDRYYIRGFQEELDSPGEWYLDRAGSNLYFWPPEPLQGKAVVAPTLRTIVEIGRDASRITLRGVDIQCGEGDAVVLTETTNCLVVGCVIRNVGDYNGSGVVINGGSGNGVAGCDISEVGRYGVAISGGDRTTLTPAGNYADNNYIHHVGVFYKQGVGISLNGVGNRASHNLIHDGPRMGILFSGNNLVIEYNHIRHMNLETEDTGAVYTGGRDWISSRGTVIRYNYFHDILGFGKKDGKWISPYYAWGVYLDDNTGGVDVIGNIVARCSRAGLHLHNGRDNLIENNVFIDNGLYQAEYSGWTESARMWLNHFPTMVKGYESVASQPAWQNMRNMKTHPKDAILPSGLIMSGNTLTRNIFYYRDPAAKLYRFSNVSFEHNTADRNLAWHCGLPVATGQFKAGKVVSDNLLANPGFEDGPAGGMPKAWMWQARPSAESKATAADDTVAEGKRSLKIEGVTAKDATCNPPWPVVVSADVAAQPGHAYRLTAKMKAGKTGTRVELMIQSYVANVYFWSRSTSASVGADWKEYELVCKLPARGEQDYKEQMKAVRARFDLPGGEGTVWIDDVRLVEVESLDEWQSLQALGFDRNSLVADPLFVAPEKDDWRLRPDSPAFKIGFQPIPVDKIGPYQDSLRASWPIIEAAGAREWLKPGDLGGQPEGNGG
ncbi:MAG: right-handed parallel beta-helix repeat-containing protein [Planctomycetota bacterium]